MCPPIARVSPPNEPRASEGVVFEVRVRDPYVDITAPNVYDAVVHDGFNVAVSLAGLRHAAEREVGVEIGPCLYLRLALGDAVETVTHKLL